VKSNAPAFLGGFMKKQSCAALFFCLILTASAFPEESGLIQCDAGTTTVSAWTGPGTAYLVDNLSCGQMVSITGLERGYVRIQIGEKSAYVDAKYVRVLQTQTSEDLQSNDQEVQEIKSEQAVLNTPKQPSAEHRQVPLPTSDKPLRRDAKIYIEDMENDLDGFIRAEMVKRKVPLNILLSPEGADYILTGTLVIQEKRSWHEGWLSAEKDHNIANIMIVDPKDNRLLWASEAGDRSWWWGALKRGGPRKTAERLVNNLKKAIK